MNFAKIENVFFIKDTGAGKGTYYCSACKDSFDAVSDFVEWLLGEEFDVTKIEEYIEEVKKRGYKYVLPINAKGYFGDSSDVLSNSMADDARVIVLYQTSDLDGVRNCRVDVGKFTLYKLIYDYARKITDFKIYVADTSSVEDIDSYVRDAMK